MSRPLRWAQASDGIGERLQALYRQLIALRAAHLALRSANFYPEPYVERSVRLDGQGYGVDQDRDIVIYHRWGEDEQGRLERFIIALNFSAFQQPADIPFSVNGRWEDVLNGGAADVSGFWLREQLLTSHWGRIYFRRN